jgi:hypothetical protein
VTPRSTLRLQVKGETCIRADSCSVGRSTRSKARMAVKSRHREHQLCHHPMGFLWASRRFGRREVRLSGSPLYVA